MLWSDCFPLVICGPHSPRVRTSVASRPFAIPPRIRGVSATFCKQCPPHTLMWLPPLCHPLSTSLHLLPHPRHPPVRPSLRAPQTESFFAISTQFANAPFPDTPTAPGSEAARSVAIYNMIQESSFVALFSASTSQYASTHAHVLCSHNKRAYLPPRQD